MIILVAGFSFAVGSATKIKGKNKEGFEQGRDEGLKEQTKERRN